MMKYLMMIIFMIPLVMSEGLMMLMYNLCFFMSFLFIFMFMNNSLWVGMSVYMGVDYYSFVLILMVMWVMGLMFMSLIGGADRMKKLVFVAMFVILYNFFSVKNIILFYFFFELSLIPTFMMVVYWGYNPERLSAAYYMLMYTMFISLPMLVWVMFMYDACGSLDMTLMMMWGSSVSLSFWMYLFVMGAFFIKMPLFMMHIWLPKAHVEAPVYGSMVLASILLKLGSYGLLRFLMIFIMGVKFSTLMVSIGMLGGAVVSMVCLVQVDMKSLVAYSSVVHMNMMLCGLVSYMQVGLVSAYMVMISHGLCSSGLFYMVNTYYGRTSSRMLMMNKGMMSALPSFTLWWFLLCSSNFSFPLSMGFLGEICFLMVMVSWDKMLMGYLILVSFFSSAYSLYLFSYVQHGEASFLNSFSSGSLMEMNVMILHYWPLVFLMVNLIFF